MKAPDGAKQSSTTIEGLYDLDLLDDAAKVLADGVEMVNEAGLDLSAPFAFWVDDVPYMIQKVTVHESH